MSGIINCDQVAWLLDIAERYIEKDSHPRISRQRDMKKYAMVYEIIEIMGADFEDEAARSNATPDFIKEAVMVDITLKRGHVA